MAAQRTRRGARPPRPPRPVGEQWEGNAQEVFLGLRDWRQLHPQATLADIEAELDRRLSRLRAQMLADLALASAATTIQAADGVPCATCGGTLRDGGVRERTLTTMGHAPVTLRRDYATCPTCGDGHFPPGP